jgi:hypothetical protein
VESLEPRLNLAAVGFVEHTIPGFAPYYPNTLEVADFDGDNDDDLIAYFDSTHDFNYYENVEGERTFSSPRKLPIIRNTRFLQAADVDRDGDIDLIGRSEGPHRLFWLENTSSSPAEWPVWDIAPEVFTYSILSTAVGDIDDDGDADIVVATNSAGHPLIEVYYNDGSGFSSDKTVLNIESDLWPQSITILDLDSDGDRDIIIGDGRTGDIDASQVIWYSNVEAGRTFSRVSNAITSVPRGRLALALADVDSDGDMDVVTLSDGDSLLAWHENVGDWILQFRPHEIAVIDYELPPSISVHAVDLDGDGDQDIVTNLPGLPWWQSFGDGLFAPEAYIATAGVTAPFSLRFADIDRDGDLDVFQGVDVQTREANLWFETVTTIPGDSNHDGRFDSTDLVHVFQRGEYEDNIPKNSTFEDGDWNGDGDFTTADLVYVFQRGGYAAVAVDEVFSTEFAGGKSGFRSNGRAKVYW